MEDSLDSDLMLVVPSSFENSESSHPTPEAFAATGDNPLGITVNLFRQVESESLTESLVENHSFSCFQLSREADHSESLRIEYNFDESDIIPPSPPEVLHIDLSNTPSVFGFFKMSKGSSSSDNDYMDEVKETGKMSPELISSSDEMPSSERSIQEEPDKQDAFEDENSSESKQNDDISAKIPGESPETILEEDAEKSVITRDPGGIYDEDTESYSQTDYSKMKCHYSEDNKQNGNSFGAFLQNCATSAVNFSPMILTASTEGGSEKPGGNLKNHNQDSVNQESDVKMVDASRNVIIEEDEKDSMSPHNSEGHLVLPGNDSQDSTQGEDLHLHLTFSQSQSQLFDLPDFPGSRDVEESQAFAENPSSSSKIPTSHQDAQHSQNPFASTNPFLNVTPTSSVSQDVNKPHISPTPDDMPFQFVTPTQKLSPAEPSHSTSNVSSTSEPLSNNPFSQNTPNSQKSVTPQNPFSQDRSHNAIASTKSLSQNAIDSHNAIFSKNPFVTSGSQNESQKFLIYDDELGSHNASATGNLSHDAPGSHNASVSPIEESTSKNPLKTSSMEDKNEDVPTPLSSTSSYQASDTIQSPPVSFQTYDQNLDPSLPENSSAPGTSINENRTEDGASCLLMEKDDSPSLLPQNPSSLLKDPPAKDEGMSQDPTPSVEIVESSNISHQGSSPAVRKESLSRDEESMDVSSSMEVQESPNTSPERASRSTSDPGYPTSQTEDSQGESESMKSTYLDENNNDNNNIGSSSRADVSGYLGGVDVPAGESTKDEEFVLANAETQPFIISNSCSQDMIIISSVEDSVPSGKDSQRSNPAETGQSSPSITNTTNPQQEDTKTLQEDKNVPMKETEDDVRYIIEKIISSVEDKLKNEVLKTTPVCEQTINEVQSRSSQENRLKADFSDIKKSEQQNEDLSAKNSPTLLEEGSDKLAKKIDFATPETISESIRNKTYDYHSQLSNEIKLKSKFTSPPSSCVRHAELSGNVRKLSKGGGGGGKPTPMEMDTNNNVAEEGGDAEVMDKSSDTLPVDDHSEQSSSLGTDSLMSPNKEEIVYRITKRTVTTIETIKNGHVINTVSFQKKPKCYTTDQDPTSTHSSSGSGYLADTSSISRTSSDTSTQTHLSLPHSPGSKPQQMGEPSLNRSLSGASSSSTTSSGSINGFRRPWSGIPVPAKTSRRISDQQSNSSGSRSSEKATSPMRSGTPIKSVPDDSAAARIIMVGSPRVVLTPVSLGQLSTEPIALEGGQMWGQSDMEVATPPTTANINPLSGSTPMPRPKNDDSGSDITASDSPEIPFPADATHVSENSSFPFDENTNLITDSPPSTATLPINEGIPIMAKAGGENFYYPGVIRKQDATSGKYTVFFEDDGREREIRENDILLIDMLPVGQEVYAQSDSDDPTDWYSAGNVLSYWREDDKRGYVVEKSDSNTQTTYVRRYSRKQVIVKQENLPGSLKHLRVQPVASPTSANVSLDNVLDGKRRIRRSAVGRSPAASQSDAPSPQTPRTPRSTRKRIAEDSQSSGSSCSVPYPSTQKSKRAKLMFGEPSVPAARRSQKMPKAPVVYNQTTIFKDCGFLLTSTTGKDQPSSDFDSPPCDGHVIFYNREVIRKQIVAGDGVVVKSFTQLMSCDRSQLYVISDNFCRTLNYFNALAAGIPCLSYLWISHSSLISKLKPTQAYLLPSGYSLKLQRPVERTSFPIQPLSGLRVSLQTKNPVTWNSLLSFAGCHTVLTSRKDTKHHECPLSCDIVVADSSCSSALINRANMLAIPVVTLEWIIQCLINSEKLPFDEDPQYKMAMDDKTK